MGIAHATLVQHLPETELVAVCSASVERTQEVATQLGVRGFTDYRELLRSGEVEAVIIATPHPLHSQIASEAFTHGVHVLCEKPLAVSLSEGRRMVQLAAQHGCLLGVMLQMRTERVHRLARKAVEDGLLGNIIRTNLIATWYRTQGYYQSASWRGTWAGEGGGVLLNQAPHQFDLLCWLAGMPVEVTAWASTRYHNIEVEDEAFACLTYASGAHGYLYVSVNEAPTLRRLEIVGEEGKILLEGEQCYLYRVEPPIPQHLHNGDMWELPTVEPVDMEIEEMPSGHAQVIRNFARVLRGEENRLIAPGEEALWSLELANAVLLSAKRHRPVQLPLDENEYDTLLAELQATSKPKEKTKELRQTDPRIASAIQQYKGGML